MRGKRSTARSVLGGAGAGGSLRGLVTCWVFRFGLLEFILAALLLRFSSLVDEDWPWNGLNDRRMGVERFAGTGAPGKFRREPTVGGIGPVNDGNGGTEL